MAVWCCSVWLAVRLERDLISYRGLPRNPCYDPELPRFKNNPRGDEYSAGLTPIYVSESIFQTRYPPTGSSGEIVIEMAMGWMHGISDGASKPGHW